MTRHPDEFEHTVLSFDAGETLSGRYRLQREIGRGGMSVIWLAADMRLDDLQVAIKLLPTALTMNAHAIARLKQEAKTLLDLSHPHIVRLMTFEQDSSRRGVAFLVMQYVDGWTLEELLAENPDGLQVDRVIRWAGQVAESIDYAHERGILHRDIKPSNIIVDRDDNAYLMDFGIARDAKDTMTRLTGRDSSGTLPYMSPQQLRGMNSRANDIYSFAATLYEAISGSPPFSTGDMQYQIMHTRPRVLDGQSDRLNRGLQAGLAKEPRDRPVSARGLVAASFMQTPLAQRSRPRWSWWRVTAGAACVALSAAGAILAVSYQGDGQKPVPIPAKGACVREGGCSVTTRKDCSDGKWTEGTVCDKATGACMRHSGCLVTTRDECENGEWTEGGDCPQVSPVPIDPSPQSISWEQARPRLYAPVMEHESFGAALAVGRQGGTLCVLAGAPEWKSARNEPDGCVFIDVSPRGGWSGEKLILGKAARKTRQEASGAAIDIDAEAGVAVIGDPKGAWDEGGPRDAGIAWLLHLSEGKPQVKPLLRPKNLQPGARFGEAVAVCGRWIVVGAPGAGKAWLYDRKRLTAASVKPVAELMPRNEDGVIGFGSTVAVSNTRAVVGAPGEFTDKHSGSVCVFDDLPGAVESKITAIERSRLVRPEGVSFKGATTFGRAVALGERYLVIGAPNVGHGDDNDDFGMGQVFVYEINEDSGGDRPIDVIRRLRAPKDAKGYGYSLSLDEPNNSVAVGAPWKHEHARHGQAFVVSLLDSGARDRSVPLSIPVEQSEDAAKFGASVALDGEDLFVGAPGWGTAVHFRGKRGG